MTQSEKLSKKIVESLRPAIHRILERELKRPVNEWKEYQTKPADMEDSAYRRCHRAAKRYKSETEFAFDIPDYNITRYEVNWYDCTNIVIMLHPQEDPLLTVGIIEVRCLNTGDAYIWNLHIDPQHRHNGCGRMLMQAAEQEAIRHNCHTATLEWDLRESPRWVLDFYTRIGYNKRESGKNNVWMVKKL